MPVVHCARRAAKPAFFRTSRRLLVFVMSSQPGHSMLLAPGAFVRHPQRPEWGMGQIQSVIGQRITVNFEDAGKQLINGAVVTLELVAQARE